MALSMPDRGLLAIAAAQDPRILIDMAAAKGVEPPMLMAGPPPTGGMNRREQRRAGMGVGSGGGEMMNGMGVPIPGGQEMPVPFDAGMGGPGPGNALSQFFQPQNASALAGLRPPAAPPMPMPATPGVPQPNPIQARPDLLMQLLMGSQPGAMAGLPQLMGR